MAEPAVEAKAKTALVLFCAACGKFFLKDRSYVTDPNRTAADGAPAVFDTLCYDGPETAFFAQFPDGAVRFVETTKDERIRVYRVALDKKNQIPDVIRHARPGKNEELLA
ncbi:MAG: hypothetical protein A3E01_10245 [Gammaproteobacteria bacterium RIFCSPHIGHO2_12_FULL_63_22]|nr:MAG: hypothetical protein A3E01_10245 [Gammaproteobacteria bacterium RIFCSPHIGHO2_12_FULL_63_22]